MKTDYTPTTGEIRNAWEGAFNCGHVSEEAENSVGPFDYSGVTGMFDRWLSGLIRKEREEAWVEGWNTGVDYYGECEVGSMTDSWKFYKDQNPYSNGSNET